MIILNEKLHDFTLKDLEPVISKYKEFYFSLIDKHGFVKIDQLNKIRGSFGGNLTKDRLNNGLKKFYFYKSSTQLLRSKSKSIESANLFNPVPIFISLVKKTQWSLVTAMNWRNFIQIEKTI